ncbi:WXG100 family type VII secretion target [Nocardioides sp.]|uniref:WXG100 family type VII secretion target n=1 Tax=Nocardioides sp. TaxID=35761 RepID=UPI003D10BA76
MTDLKVNHGGLDVAAADLSTASTRLQQLIADLESQLNARQQSWTGAAKDAYVPAKATWTTAIESMREILLQLGQAVDRSNQAFAAADVAGSRLFA